MRCIFSESLNESTLHAHHGAPPAAREVQAEGRARSNPLRNIHAARSVHVLSNIVDDLIATAFPSDCRICNAPLLRAAMLPVCDACRAGVPPQSTALCNLCGEALDIDLESARFAGPALTEGLLCHICREDPPPFARAVAHAVYEDQLREMVHLLKYERMANMAKLLGPMLAEAIASLQHEAAQELFAVAVPLWPAKQRQRGYNQSELLAAAAIKQLRRSHPHWHLRPQHALLARTRDTRSQFELNPVSRRRNLEGAFKVDTSALVPGCEVLLIDDIYTTGATARECARVLRRAGAAKVWVATVARAQIPRIALWDESSMQAKQGFT